MRNGFVFGYPNKPKRKYYSYHGILMPCYDQFDPDPFITYPEAEIETKWVVIYDEWPVQDGQWLLKYDPSYIKPSKLGDPCPHGWPDGFRRYYFFEIDYYWNGKDDFWTIRWSDGLNCCFDGGSSTRPYIHLEYSKLVWFGWDIWEDYLIYLENPDPGTNVKIWVSTTGDLPEGTPTPEGVHF